VVTSKEQEFIVRGQLSALPGFAAHPGNILLEPEPRNTAAAIGLAAIHLLHADPQAVMVVLPADHWIERREAFLSLLSGATDLTQHEALITLGIMPDRPETGYGYIRRGAPFPLASQSRQDAPPLTKQQSSLRNRLSIRPRPFSTVGNITGTPAFLCGARPPFWRRSSLTSRDSTPAWSA
jgi:hypothetical protein